MYWLSVKMRANLIEEDSALRAGIFKAWDLSVRYVSFVWAAKRFTPPMIDHRLVENIFEELDAPGEWFLDEDLDAAFLSPGGSDLKNGNRRSRSPPPPHHVPPRRARASAMDPVARIDLSPRRPRSWRIWSIGNRCCAATDNLLRRRNSPDGAPGIQLFHVLVKGERRYSAPDVVEAVPKVIFGDLILISFRHRTSNAIIQSA
jgi:hypothetical protein